MRPEGPQHLPQYFEEHHGEKGLLPLRLIRNSGPGGSRKVTLAGSPTASPLDTVTIEKIAPSCSPHEGFGSKRGPLIQS